MSDLINREDAINAIYHHFPQMTMRECADVLHEVPSALSRLSGAATQKGEPMDDLISRKAAIDALGERPIVWTDDDEYTLGARNQYDMDRLAIGTLPSAQPTLYGYQIEHLALIARVMEQEGVTPEKAVETFGNISKIVQIIVEEQREMIRKVVEKWGT